MRLYATPYHTADDPTQGFCAWISAEVKAAGSAPNKTIPQTKKDPDKISRSFKTLRTIKRTNLNIFHYNIVDFQYKNILIYIVVQVGIVSNQFYSTCIFSNCPIGHFFIFFCFFVFFQLDTTSQICRLFFELIYFFRTSAQT